MERLVVTAIMDTILSPPMRQPLLAMTWKSCVTCSTRRVHAGNGCVANDDLFAICTNAHTVAKSIHAHVVTLRPSHVAIATRAIIRCSGSRFALMFILRSYAGWVRRSSHHNR